MSAPQTPRRFGEIDEYAISEALALRAVPFGTVLRWQAIYQEPAGPRSMRHARNAIIETADPGFVPTTLPPGSVEDLGAPLEEVIAAGTHISELDDPELAHALQVHFDRVMPRLGGMAIEQGLEIPE